MIGLKIFPKGVLNLQSFIASPHIRRYTFYRKAYAMDSQAVNRVCHKSITY